MQISGLCTWWRRQQLHTRWNATQQALLPSLKAVSLLREDVNSRIDWHKPMWVDVLWCIHLIEATTAAPEEMPHSKPSSLARRRAISTLSLLLTLKISSSILGSSTLGTKPAPIPCICSATTTWDERVLCLILSLVLVVEPLFEMNYSNACSYHLYLQQNHYLRWAYMLPGPIPCTCCGTTV